MDRTSGSDLPLPLPIAQARQAAGKACSAGGNSIGECGSAVMRLADAVAYYVGSVAVAQYSQALYTDQIQADPTLNRSLRSLRRVLPGQWLVWAARGLESTRNGPVFGLYDWYTEPQVGAVAMAYEVLRRVMVERLGYTGEYGERHAVSPRVLLEMVDQYRVRRSKAVEGALSPEIAEEIARSLLTGLEAMLEEAGFLAEYPLYAPQQRQLLMGLKAATPMPPMSAPGDAAASILMYPPGEPPDYTKRPNLQAERVPLFPLDPLLVYLRCETCDRSVVAALREVVGEVPTYLGLDPRCGHDIKVA